MVYSEICHTQAYMVYCNKKVYEMSSVDAIDQIIIYSQHWDSEE